MNQMTLLRRVRKLMAVADPRWGATPAERGTARRLARRIQRVLGEMGGCVSVVVGGRLAAELSIGGAVA